MTWKYHFWLKTFLKLFLVAWMAVVIPASCGGGDDEAPKSQFVNAKAPTINVLVSEVCVFWGAKVEQADSSLLIGGEKIAEWQAGSGKVKSVELSFNGTPISMGTVISEKGYLSLKVTNEADRSANSTITLTDEVIIGLSALQELLQVDQEANLIENLTFAKNVELTKTEIEFDGQRTEIADPQHFTPEYPGSCTLFFSVKKNGTIGEVKAENLTIKPLEDYVEVVIVTADMIAKFYPWYNNLQQSTKDFIYPHLLSSYAACNWSQLDNRIHIIMGEAPKVNDVENIWTADVQDDSHAYEGYHRLRAISPDATIKSCWGGRWAQLESYINQHPDKVFLVSCAADTWWWATWEKHNINRDTQPTRNILDKENVIVIASLGNQYENLWWVYNESVKNGDKYKTSSINSKLNNKISAVWYNSWGEGNYFSPEGYGWLGSALPIWFEKDKWNILMPMIPLITKDNKESYTTASSFPTAVTSGVVWNAISIIMASHPWITAEDAMTIIVNQYLREETFQYKGVPQRWKQNETTGQLVDGGQWYFIEIQQLLEKELLLADQLNSLQFDGDEVELPLGPGLCYTGKGVQFEYGGKRYLTSEANQDVLTQALQSGTAKWYWNKTLSKKCGGKDSAQLHAYIVDKEGKRIPDLHLEINRSIK